MGAVPVGTSAARKCVPHLIWTKETSRNVAPLTANQVRPPSSVCNGGSQKEDVEAWDWESDRKYLTKSGVRVRSKIEKIIANFFTDEKIAFVYEPTITVGGIRVRPDFYLFDYDLVYEHFGLNDAAYQQAARAKISFYHRNEVPIIYTTFHDEPDMEDVIVDQLAAYALGIRPFCNLVELHSRKRHEGLL